MVFFDCALMLSLFRAEEAFQEQHDREYITEAEQRPTERPIEMGLKIWVGDVQTGSTERNNDHKGSKDEAKPVHTAYLKASGEGAAVEYYHGKYE